MQRVRPAGRYCRSHGEISVGQDHLFARTFGRDIRERASGVGTNGLRSFSRAYLVSRIVVFPSCLEPRKGIRPCKPFDGVQSPSVYAHRRQPRTAEGTTRTCPYILTVAGLGPECSCDSCRRRPQRTGGDSRTCRHTLRRTRWTAMKVRERRVRRGGFVLTTSILVSPCIGASADLSPFVSAPVREGGCIELDTPPESSDVFLLSGG